MNNNPIIIVDDDKDDCDLLLHAFRETGIENKFRCFETVTDALNYLEKTDEAIFMIICDINMPKINGLKFKEVINNNAALNDKRIPFIFLTTSGNVKDIRHAYNLCAHGYFKKPENLDAFNKLAKNIIEYWMSNELSAKI